MDRARRSVKRKLSHPVCSRFHSSIPSGLQCRGRKVELLHKNPSVYLVHNFLTDSELQHFDNLITSNEHKFSSSYTEGQDQDEDEIYSNERTSTFVYLGRGQDRVVRDVEERASGLLSLPSAHIEPLQIVRYTAGQQFTLHHDAGTLILKDTELETKCGVEQQEVLTNDKDGEDTQGDNHADTADQILHDGNGGENGSFKGDEASSEDLRTPVEKMGAVETGTYAAFDGMLRNSQGGDVVESCLGNDIPLESHESERSIGTGSALPIVIPVTQAEDSVIPVKDAVVAAAEDPVVGQVLTEVAEDQSYDGHESEEEFNTSKEEAGNQTVGLLQGDVELIPPYRLFTVFAYLTSLPPLVGCTAFPALGLRVTPVRGAAVVFCNLLPDGSGDVRVSHGGEPVPAPLVKYGMNIWACCDPLASDLGLVEGSIDAKGASEWRGQGAGGLQLSALERAEIETRVYVRMLSSESSGDDAETNGHQTTLEDEEKTRQLANQFVEQFRPQNMTVREFRVRQEVTAEIMRERNGWKEKRERLKRKVDVAKLGAVNGAQNFDRPADSIDGEAAFQIA